MPKLFHVGSALKSRAYVSGRLPLGFISPVSISTSADQPSLMNESVHSAPLICSW